MAIRRPTGGKHPDEASESKQRLGKQSREIEGHHRAGQTGIDHEQLEKMLDSIHEVAEQVEQVEEDTEELRPLVSELSVDLRETMKKVEERTGLRKVVRFAKSGRLGPRGRWKSRHDFGDAGSFSQETGAELGADYKAESRLQAGIGGAEAEAEASLDVAARASTSGEYENVVSKTDYEVEADVSAEVQAKADANLDVSGLEAGGQIGGTAEAKATAAGGVETDLVRAEAEVVAHAEAYAEADAKLQAGLRGLRAKLHGRVGAVARAEATGRFESLGIYLGGEKLDVRGNGTVAVEAGAYAEGVVRADATPIPPRALLEAEGVAFAGVRAEAIGEIGLGEFVSVQGHAGAWAGAGAEGVARLGYDEGKIRVALAGGAAVSYGAGIGGTVEVDVAKIANAAVGTGILVASSPLRYANDPREVRRDLHEVFGEWIDVGSTAQNVARLAAKHGKRAATPVAGRLARFRSAGQRSELEQAALEHAKSLDAAASEFDRVLAGLLAPPEEGSTERRKKSGKRAAKVVRIAQGLLADDRVQEAMQAIADLLDEDADNLPALIALAKIAMRLGRFEEAQQALEHTLERYSDEPNALVLLGLLEEGRGDTERALALYRRAVEVAPEAYLPRFNLGRALAAEGQWAAALVELIAVAQAHPDASDVHSVLGTAYQENGCRPDAIRCFAQAVQADPLDLDAYLTLADTLSEAGQLSAAKTVLLQAREFLPDAPLVYDKLAAVLLKLGEVAAALQALDEQVRIDEDNEDAHVNRATVALGNGNMELAARAIEALIESHPAGWRGFHLRSILFDLAHRTEDAIGDLQRAAELAPREWKPLNDWGRLLCARSLSEDDPESARTAVELLERACSLAPAEEPAPRANLMLAHARCGQEPQAIELADQLDQFEELPESIAAQVAALRAKLKHE